jgi:hypothetical protein
MASSPYSLIYDTIYNNTNAGEILVSNLTTSKEYKFKVKAFNLNGGGTFSTESIIKVCGKPTGLAQPSRLEASLSPKTITVGWQVP